MKGLLLKALYLRGVSIVDLAWLLGLPVLLLVDMHASTGTYMPSIIGYLALVLMGPFSILLVPLFLNSPDLSTIIVYAFISIIARLITLE